jgi:hypothetical protein
MKTITSFKLLTSILIFIFIIGTVTASTGTFETGKSAIISGYKSSSGNSKSAISNNYAGVVKPDIRANPAFRATIFWDPVFMNQTRHAAQTGTQSSFGTYVFRPKWSGGCCSCG